MALSNNEGKKETDIRIDGLMSEDTNEDRGPFVPTAHPSVVCKKASSAQHLLIGAERACVNVYWEMWPVLMSF